MGCLKHLKNALMKCDLFKTTEYFRYKGQAQYSTLTGGLSSIIIVTVFFIVFTNAVISTLNKANIIWQYNLVQQTSQQFSISATTTTPAKFMFAVSVSNMDMNTGQRYFDLFASQNHNFRDTNNSAEIFLQPCNRKDWVGANQTILQIYDRLNFSKFLCPSVDQKFFISGTKSAQQFKYVKISARKCDPSLSARPCASNASISSFLTDNPNFYLNFYFINTLVNPSNPKQISFYLQDRNYVPFNLQYGGLINIFMSQYTVETDQSILPNIDSRVSQGGLVNFVGQLIASRTFKNQYANIYIRKSSTSLSISRQYKKLDGTLSYIGGLFGFLMIAFVFMKIFTEYSYQLDMGDRLYHYDKNNPLNSKLFNFLTFVGYLFYSIFDSLGKTPNWQIMKKYDECRKQIQKQFDICFLMKRIIFLERSIKILFEDHQFKILHMHEKLTLKQAQQLRQFYKLRDKLNMNSEQVTDLSEYSHRKQMGQNNQSGEMNVTQNIIANDQSIHDQITNPVSVQFKSKISQSKHNEVVPQRSRATTSKLKSMKSSPNSNSVHNVSQIQLFDIERKKQSQLDHSKSLNFQPQIHSNLKILRKQSESGNSISKKIYQGFNSDVLKLIMKKIDEDKEQDFEQKIDKTSKNQKQSSNQDNEYQQQKIGQDHYMRSLILVKPKKQQKAQEEKPSNNESKQKKNQLHFQYIS